MLRLFILFLPFFLFAHSVHSEEVTEKQMLQTFNALPLSFTENQGQIDSDMKFISQVNGSTIFFTPYETTFVLPKNNEQRIEKRAVASDSATEESEYFFLKRRFLNTNSNLSVEGEERQQWNTSYFIGSNPAQWHTGVSNYEKIRVSNLYEGIDIVYYGDKNVLKYDMVIQPGTDPSKVHFYYEGAEGYNVNNDGDLEIYTPADTVIEKKPYSYQIINGDKREIDVIYKIINKNFNTIAFEVSSYDNRYPFIIDPELEYSTFLGSNGQVGGIEVDDTGCVYITGYTISWDSPLTAGEYAGESTEIFVVKFNPTGSGIIYSCLIGGENMDFGRGIKIDNDGNAFITGNSSSFDFPVTNQAYNKKLSDYSRDLVALKLNVSGDSLIYSTFIGPVTSNNPCSMDIDNLGNVYVFGKTSTSIDYFPVTSEAYDKNPNDIFLCKLNSTGTDLVYSTFFGGSDKEDYLGITVDESGNAYLTGVTYSPDFPVTDGSLNGITPWSDGFVSKFNPSGSELVYSKFLYRSHPRAITVDSYGNAYVTGCASPEFYTTPGSYKTIISGTEDVFVLKLSPSGSEILYSTFIGGSYSNWQRDLGLGITVDNTGNAYITGFTDTQDFPTTPDAYNSSYGGGEYDAFIFKLNPDGSELSYSTYIGGEEIDMGRSIAVDENGSVFIAGTTDSWDFPVTENAFDKELKDIFVCKLNFDTVHYTEENTPHLFLLKPSYPNPFNTSTTISFILPASGFTQLVIYNITGQKVRELVAETMTAGIHNFMWDGRDDGGNLLSSGVYISRLSTGKLVTHKRMLLMK